MTDVVAKEFEHIYRVGASPNAVNDYRKVPLSMDRVLATCTGDDCRKVPAAVSQFLSERLPPAVGGVGVRGEQWFLAAHVDAGGGYREVGEVPDLHFSWR